MGAWPIHLSEPWKNEVAAFVPIEPEAKPKTIAVDCKIGPCFFERRREIFAATGRLIPGKTEWMGKDFTGQMPYA